MSSLPYATDKYAYIWLCYLHRLGVHERGRSLILSAASISKTTLRLQLFQGRKHLENSDNFLIYHRLSYATKIKANKIDLEIKPLEDFDGAWECLQKQTSPFGRVILAALAFARSPDMQLNLSSANIDYAAAEALKTWLKTQAAIRQAIVTEDTMILRK